MTQPVCMRAIHQYHLILTEAAGYLCLWEHESALGRGIGQFKSCRVCVCVWLFKSMKGFRIRKRPFLRFESLDNEIGNFAFINFAQNYTVGRTIIWQQTKANLSTESRLKRWSRHPCQSQSPRSNRFFKRKMGKRNSFKKLVRNDN